MSSPEEVRAMQAIMDKMNNAMSGNVERPAHIAEAAQSVPGSVSNEAVEMYNILKRLQDATQDAAEKVVVTEKKQEPIAEPVLEAYNDDRLATKHDLAAKYQEHKREETQGMVNMQGYSIELHETRLEGKYKKTYYSISSADGVLFEDIALFESAMGIMKHLVFKKHNKVSDILELDNKYGTVLEEAAYYKHRMQTLNESHAQFDINIAKHSKAVSKMKALRADIKRLLQYKYSILTFKRIKMYLEQLSEQNVRRLQRALKEMFNMNMDLTADDAKLTKALSASKRKIAEMRDAGIEADNLKFQKYLLIRESLTKVLKDREMKRINESEELDRAEVLLAAKQMADDLQKMAEDLASMQVEELMSIHNAMKDQIGQAEADAFNTAAESAIASALESIKAANSAVSDAVLVAQGEAPANSMGDDMGGPMDDMGGAGDMGMDAGMDDMGMGDEGGLGADMGDEFAGADAADATTDELGREMKEDAYMSALKMIKEAQRNGKVNESLLKKAFAVLKK